MPITNKMKDQFLTYDLGKGFTYVYSLNFYHVKLFKGEKMIEKHEGIETTGQLGALVENWQKAIN